VRLGSFDRARAGVARGGLALALLWMAASPGRSASPDPPAALDAPASAGSRAVEPQPVAAAKPAAEVAPAGRARVGGAAKVPETSRSEKSAGTKGIQEAKRLGLDLSSNEAPLEINAGRQTLRERPDGGRISSWNGDVVLLQGDLKLSCQKLEISFASDHAGGAVERILAEGGVKIVQRDVELHCDRAIYEEQSCRAVCERTDACREQAAPAEPAFLRQGKDVVRGGRIEFDVCSGDFQVSCGASGSFQPRKPARKPEEKNPEGKN
jgi:lipopolysaccharide export system protein LptA